MTFWYASVYPSPTLSISSLQGPYLLAIWHGYVYFGKDKNRRGMQFHTERWSKFFLSSHIDLIGDQNDAQYLSICCLCLAYLVPYLPTLLGMYLPTVQRIGKKSSNAVICHPAVYYRFRDPSIEYGVVSLRYRIVLAGHRNLSWRQLSWTPLMGKYR